MEMKFESKLARYVCMYIEKSSGPNIEPYETPDIIDAGTEIASPPTI